MKTILLLTILSNLFCSCTDKETLSPKVTARDDLQPDSNQTAVPSSNNVQGLNSILSALIKQTEDEKVDYPGRDRDIESLNRLLANGSFRYVENAAKEIIEKQNNLKSKEKDGLPSILSALIKQTEDGKVDYPGRDRDIESLNRLLANGSFRYAENAAKEIIEKQLNLASASKPKTE